MQRLLREAVRPVRPVAWVKRQSPTNASPGETLSGQAHIVCFSIGRPPKTPSNIAETKEEQQIRGWKS